MRRTLIAAVAGVGGLAVAGALWWLDSYRWAGGFRTVTPHFAGVCQVVEGVPGPEDLTIDATTGIAYISSYDRSAAGRGESVPGAILAYDVDGPAPGLVNLTPDADAQFRPHGLSLYRDANGDTRLFVVNHPSGGHSVEIFDITDEGLVHARTVRGDALVSPNDLAAVGAAQFYVTNSRRHASGVLGWVEATFRMSWGNVLYFDGRAFSEAIADIGFPNGIDVGHQGEQVYVVSSFDQAVRIYRREANTGALTFDRSVVVGTRLDNVNTADAGDLWVAGRARYLDPPQPSQIVRIRLERSEDPEVEEVYVNLGDELGHASVAAVYGRHLLIGSSRGTRFLDCVMD